MPPRRPNLSPLWAVVTFMLALRVPLSFVVMLAVPVVVLVIRGLRHGPWAAGGLWWAFVWAALGGGLIGAARHLSWTPGISNAVVEVVGLALISLAVLGTGQPRASLRMLLNGLMWGLGVSWLISMGELVTGIKLLPILYADSDNALVITNKRFAVSSVYPNYNDYSVLMAVLAIGLCAQILFSRRRRHPLVRIGRLGIVLIILVLITVMGSRGSLAALGLGVVVLLLVAIRQHHPRVLTPRLVFTTLTILVCLAAAVLQSPYVRDHSTEVRGRILDGVVQMIRSDPLSGVFGWGSLSGYVTGAAQTFGDSVLMDPHNLIIEIVIWFGLAALIALAALWCAVIKEVLAENLSQVGWHEATTLAITVALPVIGIISSSTLRYHLFLLFPLMASAWHGLRTAERRRQAATLSGAGAQPQPRPQP